MTTPDLTAWKLQVCSELVKAVVPTDPDDAKPWFDIAVRAVYEYERDRERWQAGDPNFDIYQDNFIRKEYILNKRNEIRKYVLRDGVVLRWHAGPGGEGVWREDTKEALEWYLDHTDTKLKGATDGLERASEDAHVVHPEIRVRRWKETLVLPEPTVA